MTPPFRNLRALTLFRLPNTSCTSNTARPNNFIPRLFTILPRLLEPILTVLVSVRTANRSTKNNNCEPYSYCVENVVVYLGFELLYTIYMI